MEQVENKWNRLNEDERHEIYSLLFEYEYIGCNTLVNYGNWDKLSTRLKGKIKFSFQLKEMEKSPFCVI